MFGLGLPELLVLVISLAVSLWVYSDAKKRGASATAWAVGTFLLLIVFLPLYLIVRPKPQSELQPTTSQPKICANCGKYYDQILLFVLTADVRWKYK